MYDLQRASSVQWVALFFGGFLCCAELRLAVATLVNLALVIPA